MFLSIPYDEGWTITIDGQPAEGEKILEAFLSVPVEAGTHEISLTYMPGGLIPGVVISGASAAVLVLLWIVKRRRPSQAGVYLPRRPDAGPSKKTAAYQIRGGFFQY